MTANLHDWLLCSVELGDTNASFGFRDPEGAGRQRLIAEDVAYLVCDDLRHGNIVLSVDIGIDYVSDQALRRLLNIDATAEHPSLSRLHHRLAAGELQFARITPSYGADVLIAARSVSVQSEEVVADSRQ